MTLLSNKYISTQQELGLKPLDIDFLPKEFRSVIETQGYEVVYEKALMCPCKERDSDFLNTCKNCGGSGWLFVNPASTKMILTGIKINKDYDETARYDIGMMYATPVSLLKLSQMDRITVLDGETSHSQILFPSKDEISGNYFSMLHYHIKSTEYVGLFVDTSEPVTRLILNEDYTYQNKTIILNGKYNTLVDPQISIRYIHSPQFHVWDIMNDIRSVKTKAAGGGRQNNHMPMKAIVKRAHLIEDAENFDGNRFFDNSWIVSNMGCNTVAELTQQEKVIRYTDVNKIFDTMTNLQRIQIAPLFDRLINIETLVIADLTPTVVIS
jgi:hypothetical protein